MYRLVQIQFRKQDNSWRVSMNDDVGKSRLILFSRATKSDAILSAKAFCMILADGLPRGRMVELMIHNKNGQIADRNTYPVENDPPESVG